MADLSVSFSSEENLKDSSVQPVPQQAGNNLTVSFSGSTENTANRVVKEEEIQNQVTPIVPAQITAEEQTKNMLSKDEGSDSRIEAAYERALTSLSSEYGATKEERLSTAEQNIEEYQRSYRERREKGLIPTVSDSDYPYAQEGKVGIYTDFGEELPEFIKERERQRIEGFKTDLDTLREDIYYMSKDDSNIARKGLVNAMLDKGYDLNTISWTVFAGEIAPVTGAISSVAEIPETAKYIREAYKQGDMKTAAALLGVQAFDIGIGLVGLKAVKEGGKKIFSSKDVNRVKNKDKIALIKQQEAAQKEAAKKAASEKAAENVKIRNELIEEFEENTGKIISDKTEKSSPSLIVRRV